MSDKKELDPVFVLEELRRFQPTATFSMTADSYSTQPHITVTPVMRDTGSFVSKGDGEYVKFYDVLSLMVKVKESQGK